jgi:hypothetical protein
MSVRSRRNFGHNIEERRAKKKAKSAAERAKAEASIAANVALAEEMRSGGSALANLAADPMDVLAQRQTMAQYGDIAREGYTDLDRRALDQAFQQSRREEQSQRGAVMDAAARRGDVSGGNALAGSLMAQQGGANRANQFGTNVALEGRRRAMEALAAQGNMAGQMRSQGVSEQAQRGGAIDAFNQWSTGNLQNARLGQAQYQLQRADALAPWKPGDIAQSVFQGAKDTVQLGAQVAAANNDGGGKSAGNGGGANARTQAAAAQQPQALQQNAATQPRWNPATQRWE